jgi:5-enolpyruvylshikimate-3-phosphate synthase
MLGAIAGLASGEGVTIDDPDCVAVSFPGFFDLLTQLEEASSRGRWEYREA